MRGSCVQARTAKLGLAAARFAEPGSPAGGRGRMNGAEAAATLAYAAASGLTWVDAGHAEAQVVLGHALPAGADFQLCVTASPLGRDGAENLARDARASLRRLEVEGAAALIIRGADLQGPQGDVLWRAARALQADGLFRLVGVAARAADDPVALARRFAPDLMQLSSSFLDQRLVRSGALSDVAGLGVEVHLRSVFQEGLIFLPGHGLPPALAEAAPRLSRIRRAIAEAGADPLQAALAFALQRPEASAVLVGVASCAELRAVVAAAGTAAPLSLDWDGLALDLPSALDARPWDHQAAA